MYTVQELADFFKVHKNTISRLILSGKIGAVKVGRDWRITEEQVQEYIRARSTSVKKTTPARVVIQ